MDEKGLYVKYEVRKKENCELVDNCFVLRPDRDIAAIKALESYAKETQNKQLSLEITVWLESGIKGNKELYPDGGECTYCGEFTDKIRPSPFMADTGTDMCKFCWDSTKEEYANSNGDYIPYFEDYPHWKGAEK